MVAEHHGPRESAAHDRLDKLGERLSYPFGVYEVAGYDYKVGILGLKHFVHHLGGGMRGFLSILVVCIGKLHYL